MGIIGKNLQDELFAGVMTTFQFSINSRQLVFLLEINSNKIALAIFERGFMLKHAVTIATQ